MDSDDEVVDRATAVRDMDIIVREFVKYLGVSNKYEKNDIDEIGFQLPILLDCENPKWITDQLKLYTSQSNKMIKVLKGYGITCRLYKQTTSKVIFNYSFHRNRKFIASFHIDMNIQGDTLDAKLYCVSRSMKSRDIYQEILNQIEEQQS